MNKKRKERKAIEIIQKQIGKLDDPNYPADNTWKVQTSAYIKDFFGENSDQYEYIKNLPIRDPWGDITDRTNRNLISARRFLTECIQIIENRGLYDHPRENILKTMSHEAILGWLSAIVVTSFSLGIYLGNNNSNVDRYELRHELKSKKDSLKIYRNSISKLNKKPNATSTQKTPETDTAKR